MNQKNKLRVFNDAVVVVTGAGSGIGFALSRELAQRGCEVILADLQGDKVEQAARQIRDQGGKANAAQLDVRNFSDLEGLVDTAVSRTGRLDYMINNAGIGVGGHTHEYTLETWNRTIDINLKGVAYGVQAAYPLMVKQGYGHIVNVASMAGLAANGAMAAYCATKHAVVGLSKSLRSEASGYGVQVSVICPGVIRTEILDGGKYGILHGISPSEMKGVFEMGNPMDVNLFAREAVKDIGKNKAIIILPRIIRVMWWLIKLMPPSFEIRSAEKNSIMEGKKRYLEQMK